ncbi:MAG: arginine--tRNA ligase [Candidatus Aureabacteria bacterium]|nr:arginine--tRNA ligase [Candidatus Auribacterota bacterium]
MNLRGFGVTQKSRKYDLQSSLLEDLAGFLSKNLSGSVIKEDFEFIYPTGPDKGDISSNFALKKANFLKKKPLDLARELKSAIKSSPFSSAFSCIDVAPPGFLNFTYSDSVIRDALQTIEEAGDNYGKQNQDDGRRIIFEFVSANPTGPLTVAHARQAAVGDTLVRLYKKAGYLVCAEYYVNDRGVQIQNLGKSLLSRYLEMCGKKVDFPDDGYRGEYVTDLARKIYQEEGDIYLKKSEEDAVRIFSDKAYQSIFQDIKKDLKDFRVIFDSFFSEKELEEQGKIEQTIGLLKKKDLVYEKDGAVWFRTTEYQDDKDRVLIKSDGSTTYLASDIPYHWDKLKRGFDLLVNIVGPDHHGYIPRLKAAVGSFGKEHEGKLNVLIVQLATLYRGETQLRMSTRAGEFISLRELVREVGVDAGRYFFVSRRPNSLLDFDLELAKKQTPENPVFYVQYVHARIASIFRKYEESFPKRSLPGWKDLDWEKMEDDDRFLVKALLRFPDTLRSAALSFEPQRVTIYLENLAGIFHSYYNKNKILDDSNHRKMDLRLHIMRCLATVIRNGLDILGVEAPEKM